MYGKQYSDSKNFASPCTVKSNRTKIHTHTRRSEPTMRRIFQRLIRLLAVSDDVAIAIFERISNSLKNI